MKLWSAVGRCRVSGGIRRTVGVTAAVEFLKLLKLQRKLFFHRLHATQHHHTRVVFLFNRLTFLELISVPATDNIFQAIIFNKIMYALPVYFGYLTDRQKHQLQQICDRAKRRSLTLHDYNIEILAEDEYNLFRNSWSENRCLRHNYTVNEKPGAMRLGGMILCFPSLNNFNKRILLSEPCTIIFGMCSSGL